MKEYGFWEYTMPGAGECWKYSLDDWKKLLDDMAAGRMNSLALAIKWHTTGYKSSFSWLDQDPACAIIRNGNRMLLQVIEEARRRNIRVWLAAVCSHFQVKEFGLEPPHHSRSGSFYYDPDYPGVRERMTALFREIAELFGAAHGLVVEMESVEFDWPHRIPIYNAWAAKEGRKSYAELRNLPMDARAYRIHDWRDFLTIRRCLALKEIEKAVRAAGFGGKLAMICETSNEHGSFHQALNLRIYRQEMPGWGAVTYDYDRDMNRWSCADFCIVHPKEIGLETFYLGRGVMTYSRDLTISLEENWLRDMQDAVEFGADGLWFFGADAGGENCHCSLKKLKSLGYADGITARRKIIETGLNILKF